MCVGDMPELHHFIYGISASSDLGIFRGPGTSLPWILRDDRTRIMSKGPGTNFKRFPWNKDGTQSHSENNGYYQLIPMSLY